MTSLTVSQTKMVAAGLTRKVGVSAEFEKRCGALCQDESHVNRLGVRFVAIVTIKPIPDDA